tara:strand:- start:234 stop:698 length:465 start_codon:yes stop_codon:yes gene_type:complete
MKNIYLFLIIALFFSSCNLKKVEKLHGVPNLKKKSENIVLLTTNTNDIISEFGLPSTKGTFDNDLWIYIERKITSSELKTFGRRKLIINNVLLLEFNIKGILVKKEFLSIEDMNKLEINKSTTNVNNTKDSFINTFLTSIRQKINDPLRMKKIK